MRSFESVITIADKVIHILNESGQCIACKELQEAVGELKTGKDVDFILKRIIGMCHVRNFGDFSRLAASWSLPMPARRFKYSGFSRSSRHTNGKG